MTFLPTGEITVGEKPRRTKRASAASAAFDRPRCSRDSALIPGMINDGGGTAARYRDMIDSLCTSLPLHYISTLRRDPNIVFHLEPRERPFEASARHRRIHSDAGFKSNPVNGQAIDSRSLIADARWRLAR